MGSIVELSQAQLQQTDAAICYVNAQYQYRLSLSTLNFEIGTQPCRRSGRCRSRQFPRSEKRIMQKNSDRLAAFS